MSKSININFKWNKELALKTSKLYYDYDMRHSNKRYVGWVFVGLVQFGIVGALKHDSFGLLYASTFLVLYWYYGRWYLRKKMLLSFYNKKSSKDAHIHFIVNDDGLHGADDLIAWEDIYKIIKLDKGILVQSTQNTLFFENSAFASEDDKFFFIALAKKKGKI
jgi:hypothetical protein